ncbi:FAD-dependent oxidoreductase [Chloroflexota bacterium]
MLFEPINIGKVESKNRIAMAPIALTAGYKNPDGTPGQRTIDYYVERAKGGVGLIITGTTHVGNDVEPLEDVAFVKPASFSPFSELAESVHYYDTKIFVQMGPGFGRALPSELIDAGITPVSASSFPSFWRPKITARALTTEEVEKIVRAYGNAAKILVAAGIDGIEINAHGGYLLDQFMTAIWNKRNDKYGGDLKGRMRFAVEILQAIKEKAGKDIPVVYRFSLKHYLKRSGTGAVMGEVFEEAGRDIEEGLEIAKLLEQAGYDALHIDAGCWESRYWTNVPIYQPHGCMVDMAEQAKKVVSIPVITVGRINKPEMAQQILREGKADIVAMGRALWADPYWPLKVKKDMAEDIRPCIACLDGCGGRKALGKPMSCAVNPAVGREGYNDIVPAKAPKKVIIVGGGIAGMEAARIACERGHEVILYEKNTEPGGHLIEASVPDYKMDVKTLLNWYKNRISRARIECKFGIEATAESIKENKPDTVIIATGSIPIIPDTPGINKPIAVNAIDLLRGKKEAGKDVVVVGGGMIGCETALWLAQQGKRVHIVEMLPEIGTDVFFASKLMLLNLLAINKVEAIANASILEIGDKDTIIIDKCFLKRTISCDTVVLATGLRSNRELYDSLRKEIPKIYLIGDGKEPRRILNAIWDGYFIGCAV